MQLGDGENVTSLPYAAPTPTAAQTAPPVRVGSSLLSGLLCRCLKEMLCWDPPSFLTTHSTAAQEATA